MIERRLRTVAAIVAAATLLAAGCSSSGSGAKATSPTTPSTTATTATVPANPAPYAKAGPDAVGYTTLHLAGGRRVVVWYPAKPGPTAGHAQETIDIAGMLSPALQAKVPAVDRVLYKGDAFAQLAPVATPGGYPLVIFSHGYAGYPEQSVTLTTHLASWGFVVAAPDHVERSLDGLLGTAKTGVPTMTDLAVLQATVGLLVNASKAPGVLHGLVDANRIVAAGHSAGAGAAYQFASADPRVKAWISYAVGFGGQAGKAPSAPNKPGMVMLGTTDGIIPPAQSVKVYNGMHSPKYLVKIARAGHLVFSDICLIGRSSGGITGIAKALKLPIPPSLLKLGSDGCTSDHPPVEQAFPAIDQLSVAFFRWALHIDPTPIGLDTNAVAGLGANVTVQHG
jgi:predicted dienelactone hydrolase